MKITNVLNLPQPIVDAVQNDPYDSGESDISVTRLISPPRQVALANEHGRKLTEDCADRLFSLMGQAMHHILERGGDVEGTRCLLTLAVGKSQVRLISGKMAFWTIINLLQFGKL